MAIKYNKLCGICSLSKNDPKFRKRVLHATFRREGGEESLVDIAKEFNIKQSSLYSHTKKHIRDTTDQEKRRLASLMMSKRESIRAKSNHDLQVAVYKDDVMPIEQFEEGLDEYILQGKDLLDKGQIKITGKDFLTAIKIKSEIHAKKRGQDIEIMKAVYSFASGEKEHAKKETDGTPPELSASTSGGETESDNIYRTALGDATA